MLWSLNEHIIYKIARIQVDLKGRLDQFIEVILRPLRARSVHKSSVMTCGKC